MQLINTLSSYIKLYSINRNKNNDMKNRPTNFFRYSTILTLLITVFTASGLKAQNNVIDEVIWVVGDEAILKSDVEELRLNALYNGQKIEGNPYCVIPEQIAIQKLFLNQAKLDSVEVSETGVIKQADYMMSEYLKMFNSREKMEEVMNKTTSQIRKELRDNIREGELVKEVQSKIVGDIKITPAEVRRFFQDLPLDSIPYIPTKVEVQIISQEPKISLSEIDNVKKRLRDYTERVYSGELSFSTLARLYSEDPGSAIKGGELGFSSRGSFLPEFANVAFNMQDPNKISKIVETEYGYHIIQLIEKRGDRVNSRHILLRPKVSEEEILKSLNKLDSVASDIRDKKFSFDEGAKYISDDKNTRNNNGLMPNPMDNTSRFEMQILPPEVAKVVDEMQVGEVSKAFTMINNNGKEVCAIIKLKNRVDGHKATITDDYQKLRELVISKKREEILHNWIVKKQGETYVRINEGWRDCEFNYSGWIKE